VVKLQRGYYDPRGFCYTWEIHVLVDYVLKLQLAKQATSQRWVDRRVK
jgi:hypothetical protein